MFMNYRAIYKKNIGKYKARQKTIGKYRNYKAAGSPKLATKFNDIQLQWICIETYTLHIIWLKILPKE